MIFDKGREALEGLMKDAELFVTRHMRENGGCPPALFIHGEEGNAILRADALPSDRSKENFANVAHLMCVAHAADASVFVSEGWVVVRQPNKQLDLSQPPSKAPDRQEILMMMGESRQGGIQKLMPILRDQQGKFLGFGETRQIGADKAHGRFAGFIQEEMPTREMQNRAKKLLETAGVVQTERKEEGRGRGMGM